LNETPERLPLGALFLVFLKAGCAFGAGLGILAALEDEVVTRRRIVPRDEFLATYGIGRIVPSGTMTAVAVAFGHRFGGWPGTVVALLGLVLPGFVTTVALTAAYGWIESHGALDLLGATLLPAALALILVAAIRLARGAFERRVDIAIAAAGLVGAFLLKMSPALLLILGGIAGALLAAPEKDAS
jgi:chromate transporter